MFPPCSLSLACAFLLYMLSTGLFDVVFLNHSPVINSLFTLLCSASPSRSLHLDLLFSFPRLTLLSLSSSPPSSPLHRLITPLTVHLIVLPTPSPPHPIHPPTPTPCSILPLSVFCVSRILTVTQIFWPWAVPWGWAAVLAHRSEVLYYVHAASSFTHCLNARSLSFSWLQSLSRVEVET